MRPLVSSISADKPRRHEAFAWQIRQAIQLQRNLQCVAVGARLHFDRRRADLGRHTHPASVAAEPICRPLCRRRKVEFVIPGARRSTDKCLEAGVPPKLVAARGWHDRRHADVAHLAGHDIGQRQTIGVRTGNLHFNACRCESKASPDEVSAIGACRHSIGRVMVVTRREIAVTFGGSLKKPQPSDATLR